MIGLQSPLHRLCSPQLSVDFFQLISAVVFNSITRILIQCKNHIQIRFSSAASLQIAMPLYIEGCVNLVHDMSFVVTLNIGSRHIVFFFFSFRSYMVLLM